MYTTLAAVKSELLSENTNDDNELYGKIRATSRKIDRLFNSNRAVFAPVTESRRIPLRNENIAAHSIYRLPGGIAYNLLSLSSVTLSGTAISGATLYYDAPDAPARALQLPAGTTWYQYCNASVAPPNILITGTWGYHADYANAWEDEDTLQADITDASPSLTISDVDGTDAWGETPRISAGNLLKIGDEVMLVTATDVDTNIVTMRRGVNGTTAAAHSSGATVAVWQVDPPLKLHTARQVAMQYGKQGAYDGMDISGGASRQYAGAWLPELLNYLNEFNYA